MSQTQRALRARQETVPVRIGDVTVGGCRPVVIQSMTNTDTADAAGTAAQIAELHGAGSELVRITVNNREAAQKVPEIRERLQDLGVTVPLIGDFHYNGHLLLREYPESAQCLDKLRINPGNVGLGKNHDKNFATFIAIAREHGKPVRIGVNAGSLDQEVLSGLMAENASRSEPGNTEGVLLEAMVESALRSSETAQALGLPRDKIVLSCKMSNVQQMLRVYLLLSERTDHALHLGLTEAGMGTAAVVASASALAILLQQGIGDTIRVSLTPAPGASRVQEVRVCQEILQSLGLRSFKPSVIACPGCGRTTSKTFLELTLEVEEFLQARMPEWKEANPAAAELRVAVMGCVVNGPGESKSAHIGISLPGTGEAPRSPVYVDGKKVKTLEGPDLAREFLEMIEAYVGGM